MNARHALLAAISGFAGFMFGTVGVTALLASRIEFSIFVGLPVGILVGILTTWFVYWRLGRAASEPGGGRGANALVATAIAYVLAMALGVTFGGGVVTTMLGAVGVAGGVGVAYYVLEPRYRGE
jgi:hypothetical protein